MYSYIGQTEFALYILDFVSFSLTSQTKLEIGTGQENSNWCTSSGNVNEKGF